MSRGSALRIPRHAVAAVVAAEAALPASARERVEVAAGMRIEAARVPVADRAGEPIRAAPTAKPAGWSLDRIFRARTRPSSSIDLRNLDHQIFLGVLGTEREAHLATALALVQGDVGRRRAPGASRAGRHEPPVVIPAC